MKNEHVISLFLLIFVNIASLVCSVDAHKNTFSQQKDIQPNALLATKLKHTQALITLIEHALQDGLTIEQIVNKAQRSGYTQQQITDVIDIFTDQKQCQPFSNKVPITIKKSSNLKKYLLAVIVLGIGAVLAYKVYNVASETNTITPTETTSRESNGTHQAHHTHNNQQRRLGEIRPSGGNILTPEQATQANRIIINQRNAERSNEAILDTIARQFPGTEFEVQSVDANGRSITHRQIYTGPTIQIGNAAQRNNVTAVNNARGNRGHQFTGRAYSLNDEAVNTRGITSTRDGWFGWQWTWN